VAEKRSTGARHGLSMGSPNAIDNLAISRLDASSFYLLLFFKAIPWNPDSDFIIRCWRQLLVPIVDVAKSGAARLHNITVFQSDQGCATVFDRAEGMS